MGKAGITPVPEDLLAAEYIKALLEEKPFDIDGRIDYLKDHGGEQFFDPAQAHIFPREDYPLCVAYNQFPFVLRVEMGKMLKICRVDPPFE
jgi:2-phosphosulfolactate phosphatase